MVDKSKHCHFYGRYKMSLLWRIQNVTFMEGTKCHFYGRYKMSLLQRLYKTMNILINFKPWHTIPIFPDIHDDISPNTDFFHMWKLRSVILTFTTVHKIIMLLIFENYDFKLNIHNVLSLQDKVAIVTNRSHINDFNCMNGNKILKTSYARREQ